MLYYATFADDAKDEDKDYAARQGKAEWNRIKGEHDAHDVPTSQFKNARHAVNGKVNRKDGTTREFNFTYSVGYHMMKGVNDKTYSHVPGEFKKTDSRAKSKEWTATENQKDFFDTSFIHAKYCCCK